MRSRARDTPGPGRRSARRRPRSGRGVTMAIDRVFDAGMRAFTQRLRGLGGQVTQALTAGVANIAEATARRAAERTPRSDSAGSHIADGWVARAIPDGFEVVNVEPRASEPI